jgi:hypothetical protein
LRHGTVGPGQYEAGVPVEALSLAPFTGF